MNAPSWVGRRGVGCCRGRGRGGLAGSLQPVGVAERRAVLQCAANSASVCVELTCSSQLGRFGLGPECEVDAKRIPLDASADDQKIVVVLQGERFEAALVEMARANAVPAGTPALCVR